MSRVKKNFIACTLLLCTIGLSVCNSALAAGISAAQWQRLTHDPAFSYRNDKEAVAPPAKIDDGYLQRLFYALSAFFGNGAGRVLLWCLVAGIVIFIVYKILFSKDSILFGRSSKPMKEKPIGQTEEDIADTDWETLLQNAIHENDQRLAIRYTYMWLLQMLQLKGHIIFSSDKTNYDYYNELSATEYWQPFKLLSRQYEYAWYGNYSLSPVQYDDYSTLFSKLRKQLAA